MRKIAFKILWKCSFNFTSVKLNSEFRRKPTMYSALSPPHLQPFWPQRKSHQIWQAMLMPSAIPFIEQESDCNYGNVRERECRGHHHCCQVAENSAKELYKAAKNIFWPEILLAVRPPISDKRDRKDSGQNFPTIISFFRCSLDRKSICVCYKYGFIIK